MNKTKKLLPVLLGLNLLMTTAVMAFLFLTYLPADTPFPEGKEAVSYTLYIGLNDKDTYTQRMDTGDAREIVDEICSKYVDGFTASEARGSWTDEGGVLTHENTLVYMFSGASEAQITAIMDDVLMALNQSAILVSVDTVQTAYYSGAENAR